MRLCLELIGINKKKLIFLLTLSHGIIFIIGVRLGI